MEKEAIEKWIEEYVENTIHISQWIKKSVCLIREMECYQEIYYSFILLLRVILE